VVVLFILTEYAQGMTSLSIVAVGEIEVAGSIESVIGKDKKKI
jgi:hypothetical protein